MRKLILLMFVMAVTFSAAPAQQDRSSGNGKDLPNMGHAPAHPDGVGRLDLRVVDEKGDPIKGVQAKLKSKRPGGFLCESWASSNELGQAVLPPLHIGTLKLTLKADGYQTQEITVPAEDLAKPVRVTMVQK